MPFEKGKSGNPNGRPKNAKNKISKRLFDEFLSSIKEVEADEEISKGETFFKHIISRSFQNDVVAVALLKKLIPDKTFNIEDFQNGTIKVRFEIVEAEKKREDKNDKR